MNPEKRCPKGHVRQGVRRNTRWHKRSQSYVVRINVYCMVCNRERRPTGCGKGYKRLRPTCPKGHPYEGENFKVREVCAGSETREYRRCRTCERACWSRWNVRRQAKRAAAKAAARQNARAA